MSRNTRNFPKKGEEDLSDTIQKLKSQIRRLKKENKELKSQNDTLEAAWIKTEAFLQEITQGIPLEEVLEHHKLPKKYIRNLTEQIEPPKEDPKEKWKRYRETMNKDNE